jgi:hypothetical protein
MAAGIDRNEKGGFRAMVAIRIATPRQGNDLPKGANNSKTGKM